MVSVPSFAMLVMVSVSSLVLQSMVLSLLLFCRRIHPSHFWPFSLCSLKVLYGQCGASYTDKKENKILLIYKEIQISGVAKSHMRKGFQIYEEMRKYLVIYEKAISHICLCNRSLLDFLILYMRKILFSFFISLPYYFLAPPLPYVYESTLHYRVPTVYVHA
jgi:hypothetical protein